LEIQAFGSDKVDRNNVILRFVEEKPPRGSFVFLIDGYYGEF